MSEISGHPRKRHWLFFGLLTLVVLLTVFLPFALFTDTPLRISKETTYLTEPLTPDGTQVDYHKALEGRKYPPQMQTDDNGCRILTRVVGVPADIGSPAVVEQYYEKLGLSATHTPTLVHVDTHQFLINYFSANPDELEKWKEKYIAYNKTINPSFDADPASIKDHDIWVYVELKVASQDFAPWEMWLKQVDPVLDILAEAVRKPVFVTPIILTSANDIFYDSKEAQLYRNLAKSLEKRTSLRVDAGNIDGAIDDIITCRRLGLHYKNQGMLLHYFVGNVIDAIAITQGPNANPEVPMNAEQLKRMIREIEDLPEFASFQTVFNEERFFILSSIQTIAHSTNRRDLLDATINDGTWFLGLGASRGRPWEKYLESGFYASALGYDWNIITKRINEARDQMIEGKSVVVQYSRNPFVWLSQKGRSEELAKKMTEFDVSSMDKIYELENRLQCFQQMQRITLAMLLYEQKHGTLPSAWSTLGSQASSLHQAGETPAVPGHSWRVLLLPYLGDEKLKELYEKIRLDEPWDSPWNSQFHNAQIDLYSCPSARKKRTSPAKGLCDYTVILGEKTPFADRVSEGKLLGRSSKDFGPNTILLAERTDPICWMDPTQEVSQTDAETLGNLVPSELGSFHEHGSNFTLKSGAGVFISTAEADRLREYILGAAENTP